ncbi:bifunctional diguanylate cyclase/phosphohydrolase [Cohnella lupini]|uniref:Diguanylate cyclase (GGDEF)-like protein/putative nucleotidyltransferase with HDIG domain n=1 Tax=Cohnella lupini TaxID=1294267 RepID=A0A3D9HSQ6_9BACL|nr:diguanylate cyclase [Cohnella lupini]RED51896.1 diguanylate cyclase (GGDEF)-like protein/putative nucleotidyltransferase with HDIG domain [Cohnella lupini]
MGGARKIYDYIRQPGYAYVVLVCLSGASLFVFNNIHSIVVYSLSDWVMIYAFVATVLILEYFTFRIPPEGNQQSMDSTIYLATVFIYGIQFSLFVLILSSIVKILYDRSMKWWKHPLNFAIYTIMITGAATSFELLGGKVGLFDIYQFHAYIISLVIYFFLNVSLVGVYYFLLYKGVLFEIIKSFLKDVVFAYLSTLLLSIVLVILINSSNTFGLFLFLVIGMLLSHAFRQLFKMYNEMSEKANTDQRTRLYSHSYFEEKLDEYMDQAKEKDSPLSLAMIDLDDFKKYNDAYGHPQGDRLLSFFGQLIKEACEPLDLFAARYGGEEFTIIMPGFENAAAKSFIDKLRKKTNDTWFEGVDVLPHGCISFSAGVIAIHKDTYDKSQLIDWADKALYTAKSKGKNTVCIYGEESELPQSLEQDINEIEQHIKIFLSKDVYTFKHSKRVFSYAVDMADVLALNEIDRRLLVLGALIHDIGKLEIPRDILNKKTKLTNEEWEIVKKHVQWGKEIVSVTEKFKDLVPLVELHHERYDGKGYPYELKNVEIPYLARVLCIIDSFDAMTTERPYQRTKSFLEALEELRSCAGTQFDPEIVDYFIQYIESKLPSRSAIGEEVS